MHDFHLPSDCVDKEGADSCCGGGGTFGLPNVPPVNEPDLSAMYRDDPKMVVTWPPPQTKL